MISKVVVLIYILTMWDDSFPPTTSPSFVVLGSLMMTVLYGVVVLFFFMVPGNRTYDLALARQTLSH